MTWLAANVETGSPLFWTPTSTNGFGSALSVYLRKPPFLVPGGELMLGTRDKTPVKKPTKIVPLFELQPEEFTHEGYWQALRRCSPEAARPGFYFSEAFLEYFLQRMGQNGSHEVDQNGPRIMVACYALGFSE